MGHIHIEITGSFPTNGVHDVSAEEGGHANAISRAIGWLNDRLPAAIARDHELAAEGEHPPKAPLGSVCDHPIASGVRRANA